MPRETVILCRDCGADCSEGNHPPDLSEAACPFCAGPLRRYELASAGAVVLDRDHAETARAELERLIERTGGPDGFVLDQNREVSATPLALVRRELEGKRHDAHPPEYREAIEEALDVVRDVGDLTGEETALTDPLTDRTFTAFYALNQALGRARPWGADADRADPPEAS